MKYAIYLFTFIILFTTSCCKKQCCSSKNKETVKSEISAKEKESIEKQKEYDEAEKRAQLIEQMKNEEIRNEGEDYYKMAEKEIPENAIARIQRTPCFGKCPIYIMTIYNDGRVEYFGKKFVDKEGIHFAKANPKTLQSLLNEAKRVGFFELDNVYDKEAITDLPSTITTIKGEEGFKTVVNRFDGPQNLRKFETFIETTFNALSFSSPD